MKSNFLTIDPFVGFGDLKFGQTMEDTIKMMGDPEQMEEIDEEEISSIVLHYWEEGVSIFFEGVTKSVIACFETDEPEATLFGKKVFELNPKEIIDLMKENGFTKLEEDIEEGERRFTFEECLLDFFFDQDELCAISWGVFINEQGEIENID